jgi:hypothetical protein
VLHSIFHFPKPKMVLRGRRFDDLWDALAEFLTMRFMECFEWWCNLCLESQGDSFEWDNID